jgi:hypothetical protein
MSRLSRTAKKKRHKPARKAALTRADRLKAVQEILFPDSPAEWDGIPGPKTKAAWNALVVTPIVVHAKASSFADPEDVRKYRECIASGKSKDYCLKYAGDNGEGAWGDDTTGATPACALNGKWIIEAWGSVANGKHRQVKVTIGKKTVICTLKDTGAPVDRVDLNPGAVAAFGLKPPILVDAAWTWVV